MRLRWMLFGVVAQACSTPMGGVGGAAAPAPEAPVLGDSGSGVEARPAAAATAADAVVEPPEAGLPCSDELGAERVRVSCDGTRFLVRDSIELHPARALPEEPTRSALAALTDLLDAHPEILLVRIEVYVGRAVGPRPDQRRAALAEAQRRADALFQYLWRKRGISAERLEAVGYEHEPKLTASNGRWPVILRIVQRARD